MTAHSSLATRPLARFGQVYRATLDGEDVAVKVQRPEITERIALDMHLVREVLSPLAALAGAPGDLAGIADAWGAGLVDEVWAVVGSVDEMSHTDALGQPRRVTAMLGRRGDELDYATEAQNAEAFNRALAGGALADSVFAPRVVAGASTRRVLTTEWVEGERLDRTAARDDVPRLASLAMNTCE